VSQIVHLQDKLQTVGATLAQLEMQVARHPESRGLTANFLSLKRLHDGLQEEFDKEADALGMDVMHYRLLESRPSAKALSSSVGTFQNAISVAYDALLNGPKIRRTLSSLVSAETSLQVAYSYPGSFGVVFTVPNQRFLIPELPSHLERALGTVIGLGKAHGNKESISQAERQYGKATIAAVYDWAKANSTNRVGTAIQWRREKEVRIDALIQVPEFFALSESLENIVDRSVETMRVSGTLVGADISSHRFHFVTSNDRDIRGNFSTAISDTQVAEIPHKYDAIILKTTERKYAPEEEHESYFLESLSQN
jgi:hypothetical protein